MLLTDLFVGLNFKSFNSASERGPLVNTCLKLRLLDCIILPTRIIRAEHQKLGLAFI